MEEVGAIAVQMAGGAQRPQVLGVIVSGILVQVRHRQDEAPRLVQLQPPAQSDRPCAMFQPRLARLNTGPIAVLAEPARRQLYTVGDLGPVKGVARSIHRHG